MSGNPKAKGSSHPCHLYHPEVTIRVDKYLDGTGPDSLTKIYTSTFEYISLEDHRHDEGQQD